MKTVLIFSMLLSASLAGAQTVNWARQAETGPKHLLHLNTGLNYGLTFGAGYGYQVSTGMLPILLQADYSFPSGEKVLDDFKTRIGGQIRLYEINNFHFSAEVLGVFRRYENDFARLLNFGADMSGIVGYYRPKWFVAGEFGFDKAIITNFKHTQAYREIYPQVKDGWYEPATGGNFHYGLQTGITIRKTGITLKAGRLITQDFSTAPLFPFYAQLGFNRRF